MDPDANLAEQRDLAARTMAIWDSADPDTGALTEDQELELAHASYRQAELVQALDQWIAKGGALPTAWQKTQRTA